MNFRTINQELFAYIKKSPTSFHAVFQAAEFLKSQGFTPLSEADSWQLLPGEKYYVIRNHTSIFAFRMPEASAKHPVHFQIIASHSDSPCFKLKENPEMYVEKHYTKLNVERYGGSIFAPWFDRPLSIAGRVTVKDGNKISSHLIQFKDNLAMIVNLAIHMNRNVNDSNTYHAQTDMLPLISCNGTDFSIKQMAAQQLSIKPEQILSMDLFLYNCMDGTIWGAEDEFISSTKLDDLQCAFSSLKALAQDSHPEVLTAAVIFDNEEVGSQSFQSACSTFLKDCLRRISICMGYTEEEYLRVLAGSFLLSADNGHAFHPNYGSKADPTNHAYLNQGVLLKFAANQKYTSDGVTASVFQLLCEQEQIPVQIFFNHSDVPGGSTLGNLSMSQVSIPTVDIGVAMLGMHSPYETGGAKDTLYLYQAMSAFYRTHIHYLGNGSYQLEK